MGGVFTVNTRSPSGQARTGTLHLAHGDVQTPAFVPLATRGAVKTLEPRDIAGLGYELILGNTFHLFLTPGPELVAQLGGLNKFMRWDKPIVTVCRSGARSAQATVLLAKAGFDKVANLSGGMLRWRAQRFPVEGGAE